MDSTTSNVNVQIKILKSMESSLRAGHTLTKIYFSRTSPLPKFRVKTYRGSEEELTSFYRKRTVMKNSEVIKKAVFNMGGTKMASQDLRVSPSTVGKWIRNGVIPSLDKARKVAEASGFEVAMLRPRYEQ